MPDKKPTETAEQKAKREKSEALKNKQPTKEYQPGKAPWN